MMNDLFIYMWQVIIGFSSGLAVGAGFVAFLTMLGIIPRLIQLSGAHSRIPAIITSIILGSLFGTYLSFMGKPFLKGSLFLILWGSLHGIFNGMLAAALTEVLNVFPILSKRIRMQHHLKILLMAIVFGKIFGSLFQWLIFVKY